jgi:uracil-DNA glycosylase family 4
VEDSHRTQLAALTDEIVACRMCTRLVGWREKIGKEKRASYKDWEYWAKPVPSHGDPDASMLVLGLAPAAHGGNRTGRVFTGDASATFLTEAMYKAGLANQPNSDHRGDGLEFNGAYVAAAVRCVPPGDKPTPEEQRTCLPYLIRELQTLPNLKVIFALGHIAFRAGLQTLSEMASEKIRGKFLHGEVYRFGPKLPMMVACYHPSPRNTNTGVLSMGALVKVLKQAKDLSLS